MQAAREALKKIILGYGYGLPSCPDSLSQCDWWQENAVSILDDICSAFDLYESEDEAQ